MALFKYLKLGLQKSFDFSGRSSRAEFWWFQLAYVLFFMVIGVVLFVLLDMAAAILTATVGIIIGVIVLLLFLGTLIPLLAITIRRLHDINKSGWFYLISFIPYLGSLILLVFCCLESHPQTNNWGPVPGSEGANALEDSLIDFD